MNERGHVQLSARRRYADEGDHLHDDTRKRLPQFIVENVETIVREWEAFARSLIPASSDVSPLALRDHIYEILTFFVFDIQTDQSTNQEIKKSHGECARDGSISAAENHAALRLTGGFDISQMISEYRALRSSIIKLWRMSQPAMDEGDFLDMTRFNEAVDQVLTDSVAYYSRQTLRSKDMFVAVLGHDIRNPLQSIMGSAELITKLGALNEKQEMLSRNIVECVSRINSLANNLIDVTRSRLGASLTIVRSSMDMGLIGHQIVAEFRLAHPDSSIRIDVSRNVDGIWDKARIGQVFANLISNAVQYGFKGYPISVSVRGHDNNVTVEVHNHGPPIAPTKIGGIFDPLTRADPGIDERRQANNLGLGLYITHEIVVGHGGAISVTSSRDQGTRFTATFPRYHTDQVSAA